MKPDTATLQELIRSAAMKIAGQELPDLADVSARTVRTFHETVESIEGWSALGSVVDYLRPTHRDHVVGVGEVVTLSMELDPTRRLGARAIGFHVGEHEAGVVPLDVNWHASVAWKPPSPGLHAIRCEILDEKGHVLRAAYPEGAPVVHATGPAPTIAVHVELALSDENEREITALGVLAARGWQICWLDDHETDRTQEARTRIAERELPAGGLLVHPEAERGFRSLGVDFRGVQISTSVQRARANGVALIALVHDPETAPATPDLNDIQTVPREELPALATDPEWIAQQEEAARLFFASRDEAANPLRWRLDQLTGTKGVGGNDCRFELDNRAARRTLLDAIASADRTVDLQLYLLKESRFAAELSVALIRRARAGVRVRILVDSILSGQDLLGSENPVLKAFRPEPNVEVVAADQVRGTDELEVMRFKQRDHRKLIVIDEERAFVSGRNGGDEYYTGFEEVPVTDFTDSELIPWLDAHVELRGPLVAQVQATFLDAWVRNGGEPASDDPSLAHEGLEPSGSRPNDGDPRPRPAQGGVFARLVVHDGTADARCLQAYEALISGAQDHLVIVNDFPLIGSLARAILDAVGRGVHVTFLTGNAIARRDDGTFFPGSLAREVFEYMTKQKLEVLIRGGVEVFELRTPALDNIVARGGTIRPYVHAKIVSVDGLAASIGSANLDVTASYWEREANVVVEDPTFVRRLEAEIRTMVERSYRLDLDSEYWKRERARREVSARIWPDTLVS